MLPKKKINALVMVLDLQSGTKPRGQQLRSLTRETKWLIHVWDRLRLDSGGVLKCKTAVKIQLVLPVKYKETVLTASHDEMGHQGMDQTSSLIGDRFFWTQCKGY